MKTRGRKIYPKSRVIQAAQNLLWPKPELQVPKSERRIRTKLSSVILRYFNFSTKQAKLIKLLAQNGSADLIDIQVATGSESNVAAKVLVSDTKERIKSNSALSKKIGIDTFRQGKKNRYYLKILSET